MQLVGRIGAALVGAAGLAVLLAYVGGAALTGLVQGILSMNPTSALGLVLLAIALVASARPWGAAIPGALVFAIGGLSLVEYVLGISLGVSTLVPGIEAIADAPRMAPSTALSLFVLGGSVLSSRLARGTLSLGLAFVALCVSQIAILGYVYGVSSLYTVVGYTSMALLTAIGIALLSAAALLQHPSVGLAALAGDPGSAGRLVRPAIPFFFLAPFALGWLFLSAPRLGWLDIPFALAALVLSMTGLGSALTWTAALRLRELDRQREGALATLAETNRMLETTVAARTGELAETAEALRALVHLAPVGIGQLDAQGKLLTANEQWLRMSGLTMDESRGDGWVSALHPDDADRVFAEWRERAAAGAAYSGTSRVRTPDGQVNSVQVSTAPIRDRGTVTGHLASVTDVTALRAA